VRVVEAFNEAVAYSFGDEAGRVHEAIGAFIRALPLAVRGTPCAPTRPGAGDLLCAHSLPGPEMMERFDPKVLERELTEDDYVPRQGAAQLMTWGRGHTPELLERLASAWGVAVFVLGHERAETGARLVPPNAVVLNSDHENGVYVPIPLDTLPEPQAILAAARPLAGA